MCECVRAVYMGECDWIKCRVRLFSCSSSLLTANSLLPPTTNGKLSIKVKDWGSSSFFPFTRGVCLSVCACVEWRMETRILCPHFTRYCMHLYLLLAIFFLVCLRMLCASVCPTENWVLATALFPPPKKYIPNASCSHGLSSFILVVQRLWTWKVDGTLNTDRIARYIPHITHNRSKQIHFVQVEPFDKKSLLKCFFYWCFVTFDKKLFNEIIFFAHKHNSFLSFLKIWLNAPLVLVHRRKNKNVKCVQ